MRAAAQLLLLAACGLLAAGLASGVVPVAAQPPPAPAEPPADEGGVEWGPTVIEGDRKRRPQSPRPRRSQPPAGDGDRFSPQPEQEAGSRPRRRPRRQPAAPPPSPAPAPHLLDGCPLSPGERQLVLMPEGERDERLERRLRAIEERCRRLRERRARRERRQRRLRREARRQAAERRADGTPTPRAPGFVEALPGPSRASGVPDFVIRKFRVPPFLLPIYQAAAVEYGIRWEILAAINEIETDYGRNLNVSSAGALGWMQFMPASWRAYGVDANDDGVKDPYNPLDAIFAAGRYLKAAGYADDERRALYAYNHAWWYVDSVQLRARLIAGVPDTVVGSLTGLTEARFPVHAAARYADDYEDRPRGKGERERPSIRIFSRPGAPVIAVNDGVVKRIGRSERLGRYLVLEDVYGNTFTYARLGSLARVYPVPKRESGDAARRSARAIVASDPHPDSPASRGRQRERTFANPPPPERSGGHVAVKQRLFAHPDLPEARASGGLEQMLEWKARRGGRFETYRTWFSRPFGLDPSKVALRRLEQGSRLIGGTIVGRVGRTVPGVAAHLRFSIRPAGKRSPEIDPKPILDGWKLLEATALYRASGRNVLHGDGPGAMSIGQILLLPKPQLEQRVLSDERIEIYECGREDIQSGQIDRRPLAALAYLAESGLSPTVTSLKCGHSFYTASGNVSHHSSGNAVDIAKINGVPVLGHQEPGGITDQAVRGLMRLQGSMAPAQIISLLELGGATMALDDHADHIHAGWQPPPGARPRLEPFEALKPGQWSDLIDRLGKIENPQVPTKPSQFAIFRRPGNSD